MVAQSPDNLSDRDFWSNLQWEMECFPERFDLVKQHQAAGLDPRDEAFLTATPSRPQPTRFKSRNGRTVCID